MPKISVLMPIYNVEKYLNRALDSVLDQTYKDFEVICVDDGSTDNSGKIADEYAKKDKRIKVIHQENQKISITRNVCLKNASGEYVYFCDSDDIIHPQLLETAIFYALKYDADMVHFEFEKLKGYEPNIEQFEIKDIKHIVTSNPIALGIKKRGKRVNSNLWSKLYKKEILEGLNFIPKIHFEDYPFVFAVLAKHPKSVILDKKMYFYNVNMASISHIKTNVEQIESYHKGLNYLYEIYKTPTLKKEMKFIRYVLIPTILKENLHKINQANGKMKEDMLKVFAYELKDLDAKGLISFWGNRLSRYLQYKKLIRSVK